MSVWGSLPGFGWRQRRDANTRTCWNYSFQLTPEHPTAEDFEKLKYSCDTLADAAFARLNEIAPPTPTVRRRPPPPPSPATTDDRNLSTAAAVDPGPESKPAGVPDIYADAVSAEEHPGNPFTTSAASKSVSSIKKRDLYALVQQHAATDPVLGALWHQLTTVPEWVDWDQIRRGQDMFYRYGGPCLTGLAFQSLLGGLGATRVVETLTRTGGFATPVVRHRLYETTQHVLQVTQSPESLQPGGAGFISSVRVRLLHAAVRTRIRALASQDPTYFDISALGLPISDLDAAATIGTFSATIIWLALPRQGIFPTPQEEADYMALWRYVGYLVGAPDAPLQNVRAARQFMESLLMREIHPSSTSQALAANVISGLARCPPQNASPEFLHALAHWLNGHQLADALGVPRPPWQYSVLVAGQCLGFVLLCYTHRAIPWLDRRKVAAVRRVFWMVIVNGRFGLKEESNFEFKYIPQLRKTATPRANNPHVRDARTLGLRTGVESRSLLNLGAGVLLLGSACFVGWRLWSAWIL